MENVRETLDRLIRERGDEYLALSRMLGRNAAYMQQFIKRGVPKKLDEDDRRTLATYFGVSESILGAPEREGALSFVPQLAIGASAGPGTVVDDETAKRRMGFDPRWLRKLSSNPKGLTMIQVSGDSMEPTLANGDDIMVDGADGAGKLRGGIYVIRLDDVLMVKRIEPGKRGQVSVLSDNPLHEDMMAVDMARLAIVGRVVWTGHKVR